MNCKPGDLAVFVRSTAGNEGVLVVCVRLATNEELEDTNWVRHLGPVWRIDRCLRCRSGAYLPFAVDAYLRPIRDPGEDAQDEMLLIVGKPNERIPA